MKLLLALSFALLISGCSAASQVSSASNSKLCEIHGEYWLQQNEAGLDLTSKEIANRALEPRACDAITQKIIKERTFAHKKSHCEHLALYHQKGAYTHFKNTLEAIRALKMDDAECLTMAEFYLKRLEQSQAKKALIAKALQNAAQNYKPAEVAPLGSYFNPIHVNVKVED